MLLRDYLEKLYQELGINSKPKLNEKKLFSFNFRKDIQVDLKDLDPGIAMQSKICPCPNKKREELFIYIMRANLLGQGTGGSRIGLDPEEKFLTLSRGLPYELNYQSFKENLEDFINYLIYWREEVARIEKEESLL